MPIPLNKDLYRRVKKEADTIYKKHSAYKSGWIVKRYKELGGKYGDDGKERSLKRWFEEKWEDVGGKDYPVYRPTKRVSKKTPLTAQEINPENLVSQTLLKQKYRGKKNLPPFESK